MFESTAFDAFSSVEALALLATNLRISADLKSVIGPTTQRNIPSGKKQIARIIYPDTYEIAENNTLPKGIMDGKAGIKGREISCIG